MQINERSKCEILKWNRVCWTPNVFLDYHGLVTFHNLTVTRQSSSALSTSRHLSLAGRTA